VNGVSLPLLIAEACVAVALPLLTYSFTIDANSTRRGTLRNLQRGLEEAQKSGAAPQEARGTMGKAAYRLTPGASIRWIDALLARAGRPAAWPLERVLVTKLVLSVGMATVVTLFVLRDPSPRLVALAIVGALLAWGAPELILWGRGQERRQLIQLSLPDAMDQLSIAVEAGLGFEAALSHVARHGTGPLSEELIRTLQDIQVGVPRRLAYEDLAERTQVQDLGRFVRAINQAEANGISVGRVLNTQAREMRLKRRQLAEEKAMKIPVKVVFPLTLLILPVLFIVIMGPAVLNALAMF
jgi:tight adherence protein C